MESITEFAKKQGFSTALLLLIAWLLNNKLEQLEVKLWDCEASKFKNITDNNERSNKVIEGNTIALDRNTDVLETLIGTKPTTKQKIVPSHWRKDLK